MRQAGGYEHVLGNGRARHTWSDEREEAGEKDGARRLY